MSKYNDLVKKLKEIFQIDRPELDFGIYRILNAKADEINTYLETTLKKKISDALATAGNANKEELEKQLATAIKAAEDAGFNPEDSPKVKDLRQQIVAVSQGANEHENAVFSHLLSFFSRYYDSGDFVSKRRYKGDTYAIPYAGEEVMLHWANKDQYYIKSGENFANYTFKLEDGRKVSFKLLAADTAKDNRKDNEADRRFALIEPHTRIKFDDEGNEYEEEYFPVSVVSTGEQDELVIQFEYKAVKKGTKQETLVLEALQTVLASEQVQTDWLAITNREPTEKNPNRTLLEKHLTTYTQGNTADYFIHKDLGGFLSNELDFYIKNEVMNLDNVQNAEVFADIEKQLRMIQCLRSIASDVITFLAQLEDFQKKLWTKKKFVTQSDYLISITHIPEELYPEIIANHKQWENWKSLNLWDGIEEKIAFIKLNPHALVATELFKETFKHELLAQIELLDERLNGVMVNSDNYQALRLLQRNLAGKVKGIYIDPPYNTSASEILYKNSFKHSSWMSLIGSRIPLGKSLLSKNGVHCLTIDDVEYTRVKTLLDHSFDEDNCLGITVIKNNPSGRSTASGFSIAHEYGIFHGNSELTKVGRLERSQSQKDRYKEKDDVGYFEWVNYRKHGGTKEESPSMFYPIYINIELDTFRLPSLVWDENNKEWVENDSLQPNEIKVLPIDDKNISRRWKWGIERFKNSLDEFCVKKDKNGNKTIYLKARMNDEGMLPLTVWDKKEYSATSYGTNLLKDMFGDIGSFSYPKSIHAVEDSLKVLNITDQEIVLDYFAGSGTTAHATLNLNRIDNKNRKFVIAEQGAYFNSVTKPRIIKAAFAERWKNGKPLDSNGINSIFKVVKLESYEDTLNNLEIKKSGQQFDFLDSMSEAIKEDYLLNYMLETESKESLLSTDDFKKPFDYKMKIAVDSAGASEEQNIDLVETFNYLIGLHVNTIESNIERGYVRIEGTLPSGERTLVLWRDCEKIQYDDFTKFANRFDLFAKQKTFDVIYVNGDHNLPTAFTNDEGEVTRTLKLRQIEPEFLEQMFAPDELA